MNSDMFLCFYVNGFESSFYGFSLNVRATLISSRILINSYDSRYTSTLFIPPQSLSSFKTIFDTEPDEVVKYHVLVPATEYSLYRST